MKNISFIFLILAFFSCEKNATLTEITPIITATDTFLTDLTLRTIPPPSYSFSKAEFKLWIPENTTDVRAILVLTPGFNCSGTYLADDESWQQFAQQENIALMGVTFEDNDNQPGYYFSVSEETGNALIHAVQKICDKNEIPAIAQLPFLLCGHSAGGVFSYNFSTFKPERVVGYIDIKGGYTNRLNQINIPGLLVSGEFDYPEILFEKAMNIRRDDGPVCYALEPDAYHEWGDPNKIMRPFLSAVLQKRFDANNPSSHELIPVSIDSGYLGNLETYNYSLYNEYSEDKLAASWLITEEFAEKWVDYVTNK